MVTFHSCKRGGQVVVDALKHGLFCAMCGAILLDFEHRDHTHQVEYPTAPFPAEVAHLTGPTDTSTWVGVQALSTYSSSAA